MVKKNAEKDVGFVRQFNELKKKHPDAVLLFRKGDFYEMYKEDALKASVILALKVSDKILPLEKDPIKLLTFPRHELDKHLPKLIRSPHPAFSSTGRGNACQTGFLHKYISRFPYSADIGCRSGRTFIGRSYTKWRSASNVDADSTKREYPLTSCQSDSGFP